MRSRLCPESFLLRACVVQPCDRASADPVAAEATIESVNPPAAAAKTTELPSESGWVTSDSAVQAER